jgi:hypothetical protein
MLAIKVRVENGRLRLDEPTSLPDGAEVELFIVGGDDLGEEERALLLASLDRALKDEEAGRTVDVEDFLAEVRAQA